MGFSTIAATIIIFAGILFLSSMVANAMLEGQRETSQAEREKTLRDESVRKTSVALEGTSTQGGGANVRLNVYLANTGDSVLEVGKIKVLVDGVLAPNAILIDRVDGTGGVNLWAPGQELYLQIAITNQNDRVYIVFENGIGITVIP